MRAPAANDDDARLQILFHSLFLFTLSLSLSLVSSPLSILVVVRNPDTRLKFRHNRRTASNRKHHPPLKPPSATISLSNSPKTTNPERKTAPAPKTSHPQTRSSPFLLNLSLPPSLLSGPWLQRYEIGDEQSSRCLEGALAPFLSPAPRSSTRQTAAEAPAAIFSPASVAEREACLARQVAAVAAHCRTRQ